jgi:tetratricopeptide (TPR) repeat protein
MKLFVASLAILALFACSTVNAPAPAEQSSTTQEIPITSKSPQAIDHFKKGRDLADNLRQAEAAQELDQAIKLDPDFALALAYRGRVTPGPAGLKDMELAAAKTSTISQPERLLVEAMVAQRRGEFAKSAELLKQLTDQVPSDWRAHMERGSQFQFTQKHREAVDALSKATAINPDAGPAYNMLGYAHLLQGESGPAIEAFKRYATLSPSEPNPQDSLGEALMAAGQFAEAEAAFRKAIALSPTFYNAWEGVAYTKFFARDWAGGKEALANARKAASRGSDRIEIDRFAAVALLAEGNTTEGLKQIEAVGKSPDASVVDAAFTPVYRAMALVETSRYREARDVLVKASENFDATTIPPGAYANLIRWAVAVCASAAGLGGDVEAARTDVGTIDKEAATRPDNPGLQSTLQLALGMLAVAQKDQKTARTHFDQCSERDTYCQWQSLVVSQKAGDKAGADASRARLFKIYVRDPVYLYARSSVNRMRPRSSD